MKKDYYDDSWLSNNVWDKYGRDDQQGAMNEVTPEMIVKAAALVKKGKVYDLETTRFKGMPVWPGHCGFDLISYASYQGRHNMLEDKEIPNAFNWYNDGAMLDPKKDHFGVGFNTELVITPMHLGTHIDAFCHCTIGDEGAFYNDYTSSKYTTSFGPVKCDVSKIPPMVLRGVLLDMAGYKGVDHIENNYIVTAEDVEGCAKWEGVELKPGDAVCVRLGEKWPEGCCGDAGLGVSAARYLVEEGGAIVVGDDMACIDGFNADGSSSWPNHGQPVHHYLLVQNGVHIIEYLQLDELAKDKVYEFCFVCLPSKIKGATGMFIRPIAIV